MMRAEETEAIAAALVQLARFEKQLRSRNLAYAAPAIEILDASATNYTSELRVSIYLNGVLDDSLEFHIFRNGEALVSATDVSRWFSENLEGLVSSS